jgi:flavodoxin
MKALVLYDSAYGNTARVAEAIAAALAAAGQVTIVRAGEATQAQLQGVTMLVVGSPTQGFRPTQPVTHFLKALPERGLDGLQVAAFDTRIGEADIAKNRFLAVMVRLFGYAAEKIAKTLTRKGGHLVVPPAGFVVGGTEGPLLDGELERAAAWARQITAASTSASSVTDQAALSARS